MRTLLLASIVSLSASASGAQNDTMTLECVFVTTCNQDGVCAASNSRTVIFTSVPIDVGLHGEGDYIIQYDQTTAKMFQYSFPGNMTWAEGQSDIQTMIGLGQNELMWHQLQLGGEVTTSVVHFLKCEDEA